ncbi:hypothetical protein B0H19DRAFT_364262 [Mycena capillaripes]|nr:hypothetical protein B0H19DRAFT_364262 [Mycena capillaripes]
MSSPPQLHLSLPPNTTSFKRSFEQFGFDLESPSSVPRAQEPIDGTSSTASSSSSNTTSPDGDENRRKRARSSSLSDPEDRSSEASSSTLSSFASTDSFSHSNASQAPRRHLLLDLGLGRGLGSSVALGLGMAAAELQLGRATSEPPPRIPTPELLETEDVDMPDIDMDFSRREEHEEEEPTSPAEHIRRSVDRFNAFDRHISVLRSSSPPVIPLPTSLTSRQASLSPPTLPPLPLVDLGLDPDEEDEDEDEDGDDPEHIPSTVTTNTTPPRLDLNLPPTTSLSPGPISPHVAADETSAQFRERLDSAIDGLGGGNLHIEAPISPTDQQPDDGPSFERYFEAARQALASTSNASGPSTASTSAVRSRSGAASPLFDWPSTLDWNAAFPIRPSGTSAEAAQPQRSPSLTPWRPRFRPPNTAPPPAETTAADLRRLIGSSYSPPPPPRLYPRPVSLAAPLSVPATSSSLDTRGLDGDFVDAYLDFRRSNTTNRAWENALDRARTLREQRERERERERIREREQRERDRARERQIEREREEESEREREHPWSLDSIWETSSGVESFPSSARPQPWESLTLRTRRDSEREMELEMELTRRRAVQRHLQQTLDRERDMQRDEQHERAQTSSVSRAARYLESGLVDPREAPVNPSAPVRERRLRPPSDTSNPFSVSWAPRRSAQPAEDDVPAPRPRIRRSRSSSQSREGAMDWLGHLEHDTNHTHIDLFDEWLSEHPASRSVTPRTNNPYDEREDPPRRSGESSNSGELWGARTTWQPRLALSPQSTAQPTRTVTHARAQSIPSSALSSLASGTAQPSIHRLRSRVYGPPRAAGVGSTNSLVAENAAAIRRREARTELMERLNRTVSMDIDAISDPESDWELSTTRRTRIPPPVEDEMDSEDDAPRRVADAIELLGPRPPVPLRPLRFHRPRDTSTPSPPLPLRLPSGSVRPRPSVPFEHDSEEPTASSSGLNTRRHVSIHSRRPIVRLRQHPISREISPPASATASVDRRHVSWETPSREPGVSSTYQYLSALSHGNSTNESARTPPSPMWGENESPFSTLFTRSAAPSLSRSPPNMRSQETVRESSVPSLPPPDLGGDFERGEDMLRSANADEARGRAVATSSPESPVASHSTRPPLPPSSNPYTGPFRLTMQRREEGLRAQRRLPDPPSIPPLYFGGDFENSSGAPSAQEASDTRHRLLAQLSSQRPQNYQGSRLAEAERRLFSYRGPSSSSHAQSPDEDLDPRRFFPSRPTPTSSTSHVDRHPPEQRRYSATDLHNVLARQPRMEGSRLAAELPSSRSIMDNAELVASRAEDLISRYHERAEAEARESPSSSSTSPWAALPTRRSSDAVRADAESRRRRVAMATRTDAEPPQLRHRAFRDQSFHAMLGFHGHGGATARFRRRALGDYMVRPFFWPLVSEINLL